LEHPRGRNHSEDLHADGNLRLKYILKKWGANAEMAFKWARIQ
jgi:hypothetical protein